MNHRERVLTALRHEEPGRGALGDLICSGPTGTNVNDLLFVLVGQGR